MTSLLTLLCDEANLNRLPRPHGAKDFAIEDGVDVSSWNPL